jgi:hypothetical protein
VPTEQRIIIRTAEHDIIAICTVEPVALGTGPDANTAGRNRLGEVNFVVRIEAIVAGAADDDVAVSAPFEDVVTGPALDEVFAAESLYAVVARTTGE